MLTRRRRHSSRRSRRTRQHIFKAELVRGRSAGERIRTLHWLLRLFLTYMASNSVNRFCCCCCCCRRRRHYCCCNGKAHFGLVIRRHTSAKLIKSLGSSTYYVYTFLTFLYAPVCVCLENEEGAKVILLLPLLICHFYHTHTHTLPHLNCNVLLFCQVWTKNCCNAVYTHCFFASLNQGCFVFQVCPKAFHCLD